MSNDKQRAAMAAHLCEEAARRLRSDMGRNAGAVLNCAGDLLSTLVPEKDYREGLELVGLTPEQIDAAVAAIADGKPPPTSLPARVAKMRNSARREAGRAGMSDEDEWHRAGTVDTATRVLEMLGVTP